MRATDRKYPHASGLAILARVRQDCGGYVTDTDVERIADDPATRLELLLVRCGAGRFLAPAQDVAHFIACVEAGNDYVRDVSIPVNVKVGAL